jgi:hypothetical protein
MGPKAGLGGCGKSCSIGLNLCTTHLEPCGCFCQCHLVVNSETLLCTVGTELPVQCSTVNVY